MEKTIKKEVSGETSKPIIAQRVKTIKLQGKDYAQVSDRVAAFHKANKNGAIKTELELKDSLAVFRATVILDVKNPERSFPGTSMGTYSGAKALEKLETIAVGRALAFAGFLSDGEIASSEEMQKYEENQTAVNPDEAIKKLTAAKTLEELQKAWVSLTEAERQNQMIQTYKEQLKKQYANTPSRPEKPGVARTPQGEDNGDGAKEDSGIKTA